MFSARDEFWMREALALAKQAVQQGEVPVGAVIVKDNILISTGYNNPIAAQDPTAHAEIIALRAAAVYLSNYRLIDCELYVTLEPCMMCAGAIIHARIKRLIYGTLDAKTGVITSCARLLDAPFTNHKVVCQGGLLAKECGRELSEFFAQRRK